MTGATILYLSHERLPDSAGYRLVIHPPASGFPSRDAVADTVHFNSFIEGRGRPESRAVLVDSSAVQGTRRDLSRYYRRGAAAITPAG